MKIVIVYHSGFGHTKVVAEKIAAGAREIITDVIILSTEEASLNLDRLTQADALVFGSPTYFGNVSAEFKRFMESTARIWSQQRWKGKLAAAFTNSSSANGDKLNTLINISLFAAQHAMLWVPLGILPQYDKEGKQLAEPNGMASYLGLMTLSDNAHNQFNEPADLSTAGLFGQRIAEATVELKSSETTALAMK